MPFICLENGLKDAELKEYFERRPHFLRVMHYGRGSKGCPLLVFSVHVMLVS